MATFGSTPTLGDLERTYREEVMRRRAVQEDELSRLSISKKKGTKMRKLSLGQRVSLSKTMQGLVKLDYVDEDLNLNSRGRRFIAQMFFNKFEKEVGVAVNKRVIERKEEEKNDS